MSVARERWRALAGSALLMGVFPAAYLAKPWIVSTTLILCPFRAVTGRPCVFCGLTRALAYAMHGEFAEAARLHPFWWAAALLIVVLALMLLARAARPRAPIPGWFRWRPADSRLLVALVVVGSLLRALFGGGAV